MKRLLKVGAVIVLAALAICGAISLAFPEQLANLAIRTARNAAGLKPAEIDIPGFQISYLHGGLGEPLILLPGAGTDKDAWVSVSRLLTPRFQVYAVDPPGFGYSSSPADAGYRVKDQMAYLAAIAEALKLDHFDLGGNGAGGLIAAAYAATHPDQVRSLWLIDPLGVASAQLSEMQLRIKEGRGTPLFVSTPDQFRETMRYLFVHPPYIPGVVIQQMARRSALTYNQNVRMLAALEKESPALEPTVRGLATPTLIIWGARDRVVHPSGALVLKKIMPNAEVIIMPNVGHMAMMESPDAVANDYLRFRDSLPPRALEPFQP